MKDEHDPARQASQAQALKETLEQTRQEYELFAGRIAHDLHAVLCNIDGYAVALEQHLGRGLDGKGRHFLQRMRRKAVRGTGMIAALLGYDRLASSRLEIGPVNTRRLVERARERAERELADLAADGPAGDWPAEAPAAAVAWRMEGVFAPTTGDAALLERALQHLLANALKFRRDDRPLVIEITGAAREGMLELRIADTGIGFDPAEAHRLFQPFERLHEGHPAAGTGMGLACVRRILERHGGTAIADGVPGGGAVFTLALPLARGESAAAAAPDRPAGSLRVLLIDDDPLVLGSVQAMLERLGHRVSSASGGVRGLLSFEHALRNLAFDLVITDWGMPHIGGGRVAQAVKKISPATPVVVLTGRPPVGEEAADLAKVDLVLTKPLRQGQLRAALDSLGSSGPV